MYLVLQIFAIVVCVAFLFFVLRLVKKERLLLKYALLWLVLAFAMLICAIFPMPIFALAESLGFDTPSNFIFFVGFFMMIAITLSLSVIVSRQKLQIKNLTQRIALDEHDAMSKDDID